MDLKGIFGGDASILLILLLILFCFSGNIFR